MNVKNEILEACRKYEKKTGEKIDYIDFVHLNGNLAIAAINVHGKSDPHYLNEIFTLKSEKYNKKRRD